MAEDLDRIASERERWESEHVTEPVPPAETESGIPVDFLYTPADRKDADYLRGAGFPGEPPFTRGIYPTMYRGRLWTMRQYAGFGTAEDTNVWFKQLLDNGQTGLSVAFDLPSQMGYDSDDPLVEEEVGRLGVAVDSLDDFRTIFEGIPLDRVSTSFTINAPASVMLAMYLAVAEEQGVAPDRVRGTSQNEILKEFLARGTYILPPAPSLRLAVDLIEYCTREVPSFYPISISGYHVREAGGDAVMEIACGLADAVAYVEEALRRGLDLDEFAPRLSFIFGTHIDLFQEAAKLRAARRMYAKLMRDRFGARKPESQMLRIFVALFGSVLVPREPYNNVVRSTIQCLAAALGGVQAIHVTAYDEPYDIPNPEAALIALRTQQIIGYESGVTRTVDPLAGSYYVESLTDEIEERAWAYLKRIEESGGMVAAIEDGWIHREIAERALRLERELGSGERPIVGVNLFRDDAQKNREVRLFEPDPNVLSRQKERLAAVRARRDGAGVEATLRKLERAARGTENLMPPIIEAVKADATLGEIMGTLRRVFGSHRARNVVGL